MREARKIRDQLSFKEILDLEISRLELDHMQDFCEVMGKSFAVTGCVSYDTLYNSDEMKMLQKQLKIPYDVFVRCIHANQNYHYAMNKINGYA